MQENDYEKKLAHFKALIDADLIEYTAILKGRWSKDYDETSQQIFAAYLDILARGGKRLRGVLAMCAYEMGGGEDEELNIRAARIIEMIHAYLLVMDDIADRSHLRRGGPTAQIILSDLHKANGWFGDSAHFGVSQAMNAALAALHIIMQEVAELPVQDTYKLEAQIVLNRGLTKTVVGQINDINNQVIQEVGEKEIIEMMTRKTAYYSFVNPLEFGLVLAGKDFAEFVWLEDWAINMGLSYQIQDDILGIFGDDSISGKSALDDVREGKLTLLVARALSHVAESDKKIILDALGRDTITDAELEKIKEIMQTSGVLQYTLGLSEQYAKKAIAALSRSPEIYTNTSTFLAHFTRAMLKRNK